MSEPEFTACDTCDQREAISQLHPDVLARIVAIMSNYMPDVFAKHRELESKTGNKNVIGRQNLVEALAHFAVLFQRAPELNRDKQLEQVAFLEDHLRRVMMESFEVATYEAIGELCDPESKRSVERRYNSRAAPLVRRGRLPGHITPEQVTKRFEQIADDVVSARRVKVADSGWEVWRVASDDLKSAATRVEDLQREMRAAVDAATSTWRWTIGIGISLVLFVMSHLLF